ncbi:MAG: carbohydrate ABC transporter permease [Bacillota bacterium]
MKTWGYYWRNADRRHVMLMGYVFICPVVIYSLVTAFVPMVVSFYLSFTRYNMLTPAKWVGLANYRTILFADDLFWRALRNTAQYALEVLPINIILSLGLAVLVNRALRGITLFRTVYYLPVVTSIIAASMIWLWVYDPDAGLLNLLLSRFFHLPPIDWLGNPRLALHSLVLMRVWKGIGWNMVLYLAGLQGIPDSLYESAKIDGASSVQQFRFITWPMLKPVTYYIVIMGLISTFQTFGEIYAMTRGGPLDSTTTVGFLIYQRAFSHFEMGEASAIAFILFVIIFGLSLLNVKYFQYRE